MFGRFFGRETHAVGASPRVSAKRPLLRLRCKEPAEGLEARGLQFISKLHGMNRIQRRDLCFILMDDVRVQCLCRIRCQQASNKFAGMFHAAIRKMKGLSCCRPRTCDPESISVNKYFADGLDAAIKSKILILLIEHPIPGRPLKDQKLPVVGFVRCFELDSRTISGHLN